MIELRHEQRDALLLRTWTDDPSEVELFADTRKVFAQCREGVGIRDAIEHNAHEEAAGLGRVVLLRIENVAAACEERLRDSGDDARPVRSGQREDELLREMARKRRQKCVQALGLLSTTRLALPSERSRVSGATTLTRDVTPMRSFTSVASADAAAVRVSA